MRLKTLLFDLGNVLVFFSHEKMCRQIGALCGCDGDEVRRRVFDSQLQWDFERGRLSEEEFRRQLETLFERAIDEHALRRAAADIFEPNLAILPLLDDLKSRGLRLVLLSNTCVTHYEWVRSNYDVLERFDDLVLSFEAGAIKPEEAIYRSALDRIGCAPGECFYTDDVAPYVDMGRGFGLHAEVFTTTETLARQLHRFGIRL